VRYDLLLSSESTVRCRIRHFWVATRTQARDNRIGGIFPVRLEDPIPRPSQRGPRILACVGPLWPFCVLARPQTRARNTNSPRGMLLTKDSLDILDNRSCQLSVRLGATPHRDTRFRPFFTSTRTRIKRKTKYSRPKGNLTRIPFKRPSPRLDSLRGKGGFELTGQ
jgi:hypothetical protein